MKTALVYHFFPHYRAAVLRELLASPEHHYLLVGDTRAADASIETWTVSDSGRFQCAPCRRVGGAFVFQRGLVRLGLRRDLDAIIYLGNPYYLATWLSAGLARATGKRVLFWTHGWIREESGPKAALRRGFYRLADGLLLYGHYAKMAGLAAGFPPEKLHVIYNSLDYPAQRRAREQVDPAALSQLKRALFGDARTPMLVCSARLTPQCRFDLLLQAQARLRAEGHRVNVLLVGDGPERPALEGLARRLEVPVKFYGACYDEETLARLTMAAHVTVSPGKVGLTALQSLAYGTPVITHDDPQAQGPEWEAILPGRTGDFFRRGDVADLARVIRAWSREPVLDPAIRSACPRLIERFYNPVFQRRAIDRAVSGAPADDLFWMREPERSSPMETDDPRAQRPLPADKLPRPAETGRGAGPRSAALPEADGRPGPRARPTHCREPAPCA
jgi:glycosyltransferase involved in cell wall biosynthesis